MSCFWVIQEWQMSCGFEFQDARSAFRITQSGGLPLDDAVDAIDPAQGVDIAQKIPDAARQGTVEPDLEVPSAILDPDPLIGLEAAQEILALLQHLFPAVFVSVFQRRRLRTRPFWRPESG